MIITLEGPDGCGKTTIARLLSDKLCELGYDAGPMREPGGTRLGETLRRMLLDPEYPISKQTQSLLFTASRVQLLVEMSAQFDAGKILVFDRFWHSTVAYQGYGNRIPCDVIKALNQISRNALLQDPMVTTPHIMERAVVSFHLHVSKATSAKRWAATGKIADRFEGEADSFKSRVAQAYNDMEGGPTAAQYGVDLLTRIDAEGTPDEVVADIIRRVQPLLDKHAKKAV